MEELDPNNVQHDPSEGKSFFIKYIYIYIKLVICVTYMTRILH